jgi:hypothetical protein
VAFSVDGKQIFSRDQADKFVAWSVATGQMLPGIDAPDPGVVAASTSPDGKKLALPVSNWFHLVDLDISAEESAYRGNMSRLRPGWHRERAIHFENLKQIQWYAAAFHWSLAVQANPSDADARQRLNESLKHLTSAETEALRRQLAPVLKQD